MKSLFILFIFVPIFTFSSTCIDCHKGDVYYNDWKESAHFNVSVDCSTCHKGNSNEGEKEKAHSKGFKAKFSKLEIAILCGNCHENTSYIKEFNPNLSTNQLTAYKTSKHGIALFEKKDENIAVCSDCHSYHKILNVQNPLSPVYPLNIIRTCEKCHSNIELMGKYGISGKEVEDYKKSVHYELLIKKNDLSAPTCKDCHGSHGAIPPGVSTIRFVCGNCHILNQKMFEESPHKKPWEENAFNQCEECHSNHLIEKTNEEMLNSKNGICLNCHSLEDKGGQTMLHFYEKLKELKNSIEKNKLNVKKLENGGFYVEDILINLQNANESLVKGREYIHTFSKENFDKIVSEGFQIIEKEKKEIEKGFKEISSRRKGLAIFGILVFILAILLILKIREIEKK